MPYFVATCVITPSGSSLDDLRMAISDLAMEAGDRREVVGAIVQRQGEEEHVELILDVTDAAAAAAMAEEVLSDVESLGDRFGADAVTLGRIVVQEEEEPSPASQATLVEVLNEAIERVRREPSAKPTGPPPTHPYKAMRDAGTNGDNYELSTDAIIARFQQWEKIATFTITDVGYAHVNVTFQTLPERLEAFAADAVAFCPDLMNDLEELDELDDVENEEFDAMAVQGLVQQLREKKFLNFWWD